ncbi:hypothetical protein QE152_g30087 [Popillia japonica]|uniref:Uncharacterized protein n=1 Tax=Popillia japonica TaxID=7064 RepID=A0AAW1JFR1_POPJA
MKVNLAAQTLSNSVAEAMLFLRDDVNNEEFLECSGTVRFIKTMEKQYRLFKQITKCKWNSYAENPGLAITITSMLGIYEQYVKTEKLRYLLTYKCSRDHLELFVCSIRARNGWNNNPSPL